MPNRRHEFRWLKGDRVGGFVIGQSFFFFQPRSPKIHRLAATSLAGSGFHPDITGMKAPMPSA